MGAIGDMMKSERGVFTLLFLGVLAAMLFAGIPMQKVEMWAQYAGGTVAVYNVAKSVLPGARSAPAAVPEAKPDPEVLT